MSSGYYTYRLGYFQKWEYTVFKNLIKLKGKIWEALELTFQFQAPQEILIFEFSDVIGKQKKNKASIPILK